MPVSSVTEHWIKQDAITINLNHFGDPDYLQVSVLAGAVVMAFKQDVIGYNAAHNYRTWPLQAANTYLETTSAYNVYARLTRSEVNASALIIYDSVLRDIEGRAITYAENGSEILGNADTNYFYVFLGKISGTIDNNGEQIERNWEVSFRFGNLDTSQYRNEEAGGEWMKMFRLNKVTDMIEVLKTFSSAVFKKLFIGDKEVGNIHRSIDNLEIKDDVIPTTKYTEESYLSKKKDDSTPHSLSVGKNLSVGKKITSHDGLSTDDFLEGASGASVYQNKDGQWCIETDNVKARRKFSANDVEIQSTDHIGGQVILTAARMRIDYVLDESEHYRCYFRKADGEGNVIRNEWKPSDLAYCNTFNLERQSDGSIGNHYYWRKVVAVSSEANQDAESERTFGDETIRTADYHFVDLSKLEYAGGSNAPKAGDKVVQLGYSKDDDSGRQAAIVIAGAGTGSPYIQIFEGIHDFSLPSNPDQLKPGDNRLSGRLTIKEGSTGWQNLEGLPGSIQEALNMSSDAKGAVDNLEGGSGNLLRNTGFFGDYVSASLLGEVVLSETSEMYSPSLQHWTTVLATAVEMDESKSGKGVQIFDGGYIQQRIFYQPVEGENYVVSFRGKGGSVTVRIGDYRKAFDLSSDTFDLYFDKFVASGDLRRIRFEIAGDCELCEIQLEQGTIRSAWSMSPLDNQSAQAQYESMTYLKQAVEDGSSEFVGGLGLANLMFAKDLENKITAGMSGIHNDDHSVAFFAGGNYEQAIDTALKYADNPSYQASESEIQNMAKFVVTHGGRAILNDVVLRGYIYALGGKFKGVVEATDGKFRGEVEATSGTFNNVSFQSGFIGGFRVSGNGIISQIGENSFDNDAYIRLKNTSEDTEAAIGGNVVSPSTGRKLLARFVNENDKLSRYSSLPNECFEIGAKGAIDNIALSIDGGCIEGLAYRTYTVSSSGTSNIPKNVTEVLCTNTQVINVYLPSLDICDDGHVVRVTRTGSEFWLYPFDCNTLNTYEPVYGRTLIYHEGNYYSYSNPISIQSWHTCELVWHRDFSKTINGVEYRGVWILTA